MPGNYIMNLSPSGAAKEDRHRRRGLANIQY